MTSEETSETTPVDLFMVGKRRGYDAVVTL